MPPKASTRRKCMLFALVLAVVLSKVPHLRGEHSIVPRDSEANVDPAVEEGEDICISMMLLGCMGFMMATFYLVHWPDDDIQEITWEIISSTTSIFGALLLFQGCNRVVNYYFLDQVTTWYQIAVNGIHMMLWFCVLQLVLAYYSGSLGQQKVPALRREALAQAESSDGEMRLAHLQRAEKHLHQIKANTHAWAVLMGHITGFAAVNTWSAVQQEVPTFLSPAIPVAAYVGISYIYKITSQWRLNRIMADGEEDEYEVIWGECVAETEDEVISLSVSFLIAQVLRLCITGDLPGAGGEEPKGSWHSKGSCLLLLLMGFVLGGAELVRLMHSRSQSFKRAVSPGEETCRTGNWYEQISAMSFAWCFHIAVDWWVGSCLNIDNSMKAVVSALAGTFFAFVLIFGLDKIADMNAHDPEIDGALRTIISALGMLVGMSWERCFDTAVAAVAKEHVGRLPPPVMNLLLAILLAAIVLPAWKWHIHPKLHEHQERLHHEPAAPAAPVDLGETTRLFGRLGEAHVVCKAEKLDQCEDGTLSLSLTDAEEDSEMKNLAGEGQRSASSEDLRPKSQESTLLLSDDLGTVSEVAQKPVPSSGTSGPGAEQSQISEDLLGNERVDAKGTLCSTGVLENFGRASFHKGKDIQRPLTDLLGSPSTDTQVSLWSEPSLGNEALLEDLLGGSVDTHQVGATGPLAPAHKPVALRASGLEPRDCHAPNPNLRVVGVCSTPPVAASTETSSEPLLKGKDVEELLPGDLDDEDLMSLDMPNRPYSTHTFRNFGTGLISL